MMMWHVPIFFIEIHIELIQSFSSLMMYDLRRFLSHNFKLLATCQTV